MFVEFVEFVDGDSGHGGCNSGSDQVLRDFLHDFTSISFSLSLAHRYAKVNDMSLNSFSALYSIVGGAGRKSEQFPPHQVLMYPSCICTSHRRFY